MFAYLLVRFSSLVTFIHRALLRLFLAFLGMNGRFLAYLGNEAQHQQFFPLSNAIFLATGSKIARPFRWEWVRQLTGALDPNVRQIDEEEIVMIVTLLL